MERREGGSSRANARTQDLEFIGIYHNKSHWYAKVDSLNGSRDHVGPFRTDVVAAIYHDVLATPPWILLRIKLSGGDIRTQGPLCGVCLVRV